jgi:hypothetical protein
MKKTDLSGERFGRLVALTYVESGAGGNAIWLWACDCGKQKRILANVVKSGRSKSCGCWRAESSAILGVRHTRHGHATRDMESRTYRSWRQMLDRCRRKKNKKYASYGERGITVCERWHTFENFLADMGEVPANLSLDRFPDNNGNYEPGNCRWATQVEQARNKRVSIYVTLNGQRVFLKDAAMMCGVNYRTALTRRRKGWSVDRILAS